MSITSKAFEDWKDAFSELSAYRGIQAERDEGKEMTPIESTLKKIDALAKDDLPAGFLRKNVLYACYQAAQSLKSGRDPGDERREELKQSFESLFNQTKKLKAVAELLASNPEAVKLAVDYFNTVPSIRKEHSTHLRGTSMSGSLVDALHRVVDFSARYKDDPRMVTGDMFYDCAEGPFLFFNRNDNRYRSSARTYTHRRLVWLGLIFHLTYLFRYFSCTSEDRGVQSKMRSDGELQIEGRMLTSGKNKYSYIAHLLNALLKPKTAFQATDSKKVESDLDGLLNPNKLKKGKANLLIYVGSKDGKHGYVRRDIDALAPGAFEGIEFIGWPQPLP